MFVIKIRASGDEIVLAHHHPHIFEGGRVRLNGFLKVIGAAWSNHLPHRVARHGRGKARSPLLHGRYIMCDT